jgi:ubiquinone/menaquinone biosynthesis C-methylase UbiE/DNA-binding transcriptional ArsR family regulator
VYVDDPSALFRLLADDVRLRLLRLLAAERLNVSELTSLLGIAQSGVSRHLGLLKDARLVTEEKEGGYTYFKVADDLRRGRDGFGPLWPLLESQFKALRRTPAGREDDARLQEVMRLRKENFEAHAGPDARRSHQLVPGRSWAAWARALGHLLPPLEVADLGCGEGYLSIEAARWAKRVIAIDRSADVLARAKELAARRRVRNVTWKRGEIERVPLPDASVDVALLSQALHHATQPAAALAEAARIVRPGGRVLVLDLRSHDEQWVKTRLGDRWLGFEDDELKAFMNDAGLSDVKVTVGSRKTGDPFTVLVASGRREASGVKRHQQLPEA